MRHLPLALGCLFAAAFFVTPSASATSLQVAPLEYRTELKKGEKKKGFIDVSNPTKATVRIKASAQAFRQINDSGSLQFYDNEQVRAGVMLDLDEFELGPREAVRMYFILDSTRLPSGDVYGAIFFTTAPASPSVEKTGIGQSVRLGTLLSIVNGTPGPRDAEITGLSVPWLQLSGAVSGSYRIKNVADSRKATGFYPTVQIRSEPFGEAKKLTGKLTFAGITRTNEFELKTLPIGVYKVSVGYDSSVKSQWVVVASPLALIIFLALLISFLTGISYRRWYKRRRKFQLDR